MDKKYKSTKNTIVVFWVGIFAFGGLDIFAGLGSTIFLARIWVIVFTLVFIYLGFRMAGFGYQDSNHKFLYALLWAVIGSFSIFLLTIPLLILNGKVRDKEIMSNKV